MSDEDVEDVERCKLVIKRYLESQEGRAASHEEVEEFWEWVRNIDFKVALLSLFLDGSLDARMVNGEPEFRQAAQPAETAPEKAQESTLDWAREKLTADNLSDGPRVLCDDYVKRFEPE